jgi:FkbM family methyltransferase
MFISKPKVHPIRALKYAWHKTIIAPLRRVQWGYKSVSFIHKASTGRQFHLYPGESIDGCIFVDGAYELRFLRLVENYVRLRPGSVMLDVGANIGNHAIYLSSAFQKIHCFEPSPVIADRLDANIALNGFNNIEVHRVGLSDRTGMLHFKLDRTGNLGASHFQEMANDETVELQVHAGDEYLANLDRLDFIKIDAERHEGEVLRGLDNIVRQHRPIVAFELHGGDGERHFNNIVSSLPGYIMTEPMFAPWQDTRLQKFVWQLRGQITFPEISTPQSRFYENVIAFPNQATLMAFKTANSR